MVLSSRQDGFINRHMALSCFVVGEGRGIPGHASLKYFENSASNGCIWCILGINSAPLCKLTDNTIQEFFLSNACYFLPVALFRKCEHAVV